MKIRQSYRVFLAAVMFVFLWPTSWAEEHDSDQGDEAREEFIELAGQLDREFNSVTTKVAFLEKTLSPQELQEKFESVLKDGLVANEIQALLHFEERHRSSFLGLMALRKILLHAHRFGPPRPTPTQEGKREVLDRLVHYVTLPIAAEIINRTPGGFPDRMVEPALRKIVASPKAKPKVRQASRLTLAQWLIRWNDFVKHRDKQAEALAKLQRIKSPTVEERSQMSSLEAIHRSLPSNDENRRWQVEAESLLADLEASKRSTKIPELKAVGRHIVRIDLEATKDKATIAELARATRFNRVGNSVGELGANLINGERWNLIAKAGDVVILQFSFTGCLPCIKMYQELADLQSKHPEELSLLTVMQDPQEQDTKETAAKYELSWSVCWDGDPGDITQRFAIQSFPAVVVLDREGKIVGRTLDDARRLLEGSSALRAE